MNDHFDYMSMLEEAKKELKEPAPEEARFKMPEVDSFIEGKQTIFRNFSQIVDAINRDSDHLLGHLVKEVGAPGYVDDSGRLILKARLTKDDLNRKIKAYLDSFVLCSECMRPDTHLIKEGRTMIIICDACGGRRPVHVKKGVKADDTSQAPKPGDVINVQIQDIGQKGDGIARMGNLVIFVPGTKKGDQVKVRIDSISSNKYVQARVVQE